MITPIFRLTQDDDYLYVTLVSPNIHLSEAELYHDENEFIFHANPYYLRLELPAKVQSSERIESSIDNDDEDNKSSSSILNNNEKRMQFDYKNKELIISVKKLISGQHFDNLEMVGRFLSGPKTKASRRLVEVLNTQTDTPILNELLDNDEDDDFDWNIEQKYPQQEAETVADLMGNNPYGFANSQTGVLERLGEQITHELVDIERPGKTRNIDRRRMRLKHELDHFNDEHYLADLYERDQIDQLIMAPAPWELWDHTKPDTILTDNDRQRMIDRLPKRDFVRYDTDTKKALMLGVVDLLYAYAYDLRTNEFEHSTESGWTVRKLSSTLSWFEYWTPFEEIIENDLRQRDMAIYVILNCIRRSLIYPLYRNWDLAIRVVQDVTCIMSKGRTAILKCFLDLHQLLNETGDNYYLLNDLYITDYCCWLQQSTRTDQFDTLAEHLRSRLQRLDKDDVQLELKLTEQVAEMVRNETHGQMDAISEKLRDKLVIENVKRSTKTNLDSDDDSD